MTTQHCPHPHRGVGHWPVAHALPAVNVHGAAATNAAVLGPAPVMPRPATAAQRDSAAAHPQEQTRSTTAAPEYRPHKINLDRKSTRLNSSHVAISYAVFCLKQNNGV